MTRQPLLTKPKAKRQYPETELQKAVVQVLMLFGKRDVVWYSIPNGAKLAKRTAIYLKQTGMVAGAADLAFVVNGYAYFMELKAGKGKQSPEQKAFESRVFASKSSYIVVNDIDVAIDYLEAWGVIRPYPRRSRITL